MALTYAQNKKYIMKWKANNKEAVKLNDRICQKRRYTWKKIQKEFCFILIDDWNIVCAC